MKLRVSHETSYTYARPMRTLVQSVRLFPSRFDGQKVEDWQVTVEGFGPVAEQEMTQTLGTMTQTLSQGGGTQSVPAGEAAHIGAAFRDGCGDWTETVSVRGPVTGVRISVEGVVETADLAGMLKGHRETVPPAVYLQSTLATEADVALTELARKVIAGTEGQTQLNRAHALSAAVSDAIDYVPGETHSGTTAAEALAAGKGVCQDHAHALIALAHLADLPARYVVGYLFAADSETEASHAWAELHVGELGWIGFDPANRCCPDDRYIRLCSGFDAQDAAPIRGIAQGTEAGTLDVSVAVQRQGQ